MVVDCSGPFQTAGSALIEAAIAARCNYVDLADSRAWVAGINRFDGAARAAGISISSGASATPALTHAVVEAMTAAWLSIDSIDVAVLPGNRTLRGKAVVAAILEWVGKPVQVFDAGAWRKRYGWSGTHAITADGLGRRLAALADVPDLDSLPAQFQPRIRASFDAGLELKFLHRMVSFAGWLVRWHLLSSARWAAGPGHAIAKWFQRFGSDKGGMVVDIAGQDARGEVRLLRWTLTAGKGDGPYVPVLAAAALIEAIANGKGPRAGAASAAGAVKLGEIRSWFDGLDIEAQHASYRDEKPVFKRAMGADFEHLPAVIRQVHRGRPALVADGVVRVSGATNLVGKLCAALVGLPGNLGEVPLHVAVETRNGRELWARFFGDRALRSEIRPVGEGMIEECIGRLRLRLEPVAVSDGLDFRAVSTHVGWLPLSSARIVMSERADPDGRHAFFTEIGFPIVGRLASWRGVLSV